MRTGIVRTSLISILLVAGSVLCAAQSAEAQPVDLSGIAVAEAPEDISVALATIIKGTKVPSLAAAAVLDGRIVAAGAAGVRKRGNPTPVALADRYHIGSCTKSMTATLAAILVSEGKVKWETTVREVFRGLGVHEDLSGATLRQLLAHRAGCPRDIKPSLWGELWKAQGPPRAQRMQLVEGILSKPPRSRPGTAWEYSNAGVSIAGAMLETVTNNPYEKLMREKLFGPLEMKSAGFRAPATVGKIDQPYGHNPNPVDPEPAGDNPAAIAPAGAVHCSIIDFAKYARFHLGRGPEGILTKRDLAFLHLPVSPKDGYALGWIVTQRPWAGGTALTHTGCNTMFYSVMWLAPKRDFAAVAACNLGTQNGFKKCDEAAAYLIRKYLMEGSKTDGGDSK